MRHPGNSVRISASLKDIRARAGEEIRRRESARELLGADDLQIMKEAAAMLEKNPELRLQFSETMATLKECGVVSRIDSHHWDRGLCELESDGEVVCVADGHVLCYDDDEEIASVIPPEEVRVIGGARS